ncbi:hypothetical protein KHQ81_15455 (plasmid) [Mycoplasmatota bacterium]|nr:hypothetical protein KHQ81_15455 [Mycoplasmatota bacterium]
MSERDLDLVLNSMQRFILGLEDILISYFKAMANAQNEFDKKFATTQMKLDLVKRQQFHAGMDIFGNNFLFNEIISDLSQQGLVTSFTLSNVKAYLKTQDIEKEVKNNFLRDLKNLREGIEDYKTFLINNENVFKSFDQDFKLNDVISFFNSDSLTEDYKEYLMEETKKSPLDKDKLREISKINILKDMEDGKIDQITPDMKTALKHNYLSLGLGKNSWLNTQFIDETNKILNNCELHGYESNKNLRIGMFKANLKVKDLDEFFTYRHSLSNQYSYTDRAVTKMWDFINDKYQSFKTRKVQVNNTDEEAPPTPSKESFEDFEKEMDEKHIENLQKIRVHYGTSSIENIDINEPDIEDSVSRLVVHASVEPKKVLGIMPYPQEVGTFIYDTKNSPIERDIVGAIDEAIKGTNRNHKVLMEKLNEKFKSCIDNQNFDELQGIIERKPEAVLLIDELELEPEVKGFVQKISADSLYTRDNAINNDNTIEIENRNRAYQILKAFELEHEKMNYKALLKKKAEREHIAEIEAKLENLKKSAFGEKSIAELPPVFAGISLNHCVENGMLNEEHIQTLLNELNNQGMNVGELQQSYSYSKKISKSFDNSLEMNMFKR